MLWVLGCVFKVFLHFVALAFYLIGNKIVLQYLGESMLKYHGMDTMTSVGISTYYERLICLYKVFIGGFDYRILVDDTDIISHIIFTKSANMYPGNLKILYYTVLVSIILYILISIFKLVVAEKRRAFFLILLMLLSPAMINSIYIVSEPKIVYTLTVYAGVMFLFIPILFWESSIVERYASDGLVAKYNTLVAVVIIVMSIGFIRFDNIAYLKAKIFQTQCISYYTSLISRIKSLDGYREDMKIAYIKTEMGGIHDKTVTVYPEFEVVNILPYYPNSYIIRYVAYKEIMKLWCGFDPEIVDGDLYKFRDDVKVMPTYPNSGSLKIIGDVVVVKF